MPLKRPDEAEGIHIRFKNQAHVSRPLSGLGFMQKGSLMFYAWTNHWCWPHWCTPGSTGHGRMGCWCSSEHLLRLMSLYDDRRGASLVLGADSLPTFSSVCTTSRCSVILPEGSGPVLILARLWLIPIWALWSVTVLTAGTGPPFLLVQHLSDRLFNIFWGEFWEFNCLILISIHHIAPPQTSQHLLLSDSFGIKHRR